MSNFVPLTKLYVADSVLTLVGIYFYTFAIIGILFVYDLVSNYPFYPNTLTVYLMF
jgi:hypothetical protein